MKELLHCGELTERDKALIIDGIPETNLVLYCPGLQGKGSSLLDRSANANHGTITGATWTRLPSGLYVLSFNGSTSKVSFSAGAGTPLDIDTGAVVLESWFNTDTIAAGEAQIIGRGTEGASGWRLVRNAATLKLGYSGSGTITSTAILVAGTWVHALGVINGASSVLYINGVSAATGTVNPVAATKDVYMGCVHRETDAEALFFDGLIAIPRIYNATKAAAVPLAHYTRERHLFGV